MVTFGVSDTNVASHTRVTSGDLPDRRRRHARRAKTTVWVYKLQEFLWVCTEGAAPIGFRLWDCTDEGGRLAQQGTLLKLGCAWLERIDAVRFRP